MITYYTVLYYETVIIIIIHLLRIIAEKSFKCYHKNMNGCSTIDLKWDPMKYWDKKLS